MKNIYTLMLLVLFCLESKINIAQQTIAGIVIDEMGDPLVGANIWIDGTTTGTYTLAGGRFAIQVPVDYFDINLNISYLGYRTKVIPINLDNFDFNLKKKIYLGRDYTTLSEIVVTEFKVPPISWTCGTTGAVIQENCFATTRCNSAENCNGNGNHTETDDSSKSIIQVFPNPFVRSFNLNLTVETDEECLFQFHGIDGKFIFEERRLLTPETDLLTFNLPNPNLPAGAYVLSIHSKNKHVQSMILDKVNIE